VLLRYKADVIVDNIHHVGKCAVRTGAANLSTAAATGENICRKLAGKIMAFPSDATISYVPIYLSMDNNATS
jgi:hypothetical protein